MDAHRSVMNTIKNRTKSAVAPAAVLLAITSYGRAILRIKAKKPDERLIIRMRMLSPRKFKNVCLFFIR